MTLPNSGTLSPANAAGVRGALLRWFQRNARPLPWRRSRLLYPVWVSEVMLQQTQVAAVVPYFRNFLRAFPNLESLAKSRLERVLEIWSGLGYYRRAGNLHRAARIVEKKFGGRFPRDLAGARSLPGVGDYTARAVLSIAYGQPYAVRDGTVVRVMARLGGWRGRSLRAYFRHKLESALAQALSRRNPGDFNQAIMELGQTVCLPRAPRCPQCPLRKWCAACRLGMPELFPSPRQRRAIERRHLAAAVIQDSKSRVALVRGLDEGLLKEVWNFPSALGGTRREARDRLIQKVENITHRRVELGQPLSSFKHGITFRSIEALPYPGRLLGAGKTQGVRWVSAPRLPQKAVSQLTHKIAKLIATKDGRFSSPR